MVWKQPSQGTSIDASIHLVQVARSICEEEGIVVSWGWVPGNRGIWSWLDEKGTQYF